MLNPVFIATDGHVMEGTLSCAGCGVPWPITRGIPRFYREGGKNSEQKNLEVFSFGARAFNKDGGNSPDESLALEYLFPLGKSDFEGKAVLDAGCGLGGFSKQVAGWESQLVVGIDASLAIEVAFEKTRHLPNVLMIQASLYELPLAKSFDRILCFGVLQHLSQPEKALKTMQNQMLRDSRLVLWVLGVSSKGQFLAILRKLISLFPLNIKKVICIALAHIFRWFSISKTPTNSQSTQELSRMIYDHLAPEFGTPMGEKELLGMASQTELAIVSPPKRLGGGWQAVLGKKSDRFPS